MTRRFFVYDTISGISGQDALKNLNNLNDNGLPNEQIEMVRYAKNMTLKIMLDTDINRPEAIFVPYLAIEKKKKKTNKILGEEDARFKNVFFISEYTMDTEGFWNLARTCFWMAFALMMILFLISTAIHSRQ